MKKPHDNTFQLKDEKATLQFGAKLAKRLPNNIVIFLEGELGAGKTTLVRGILNALGYKGTVKSPTYTLVEPYFLHKKNIYHFDLYRLKDPEELELIGIRDYFGDSICLIEWPERGKGCLPLADLRLEFLILQIGRSIKMTAQTEAGEKLVKRILEKK